MKIPVLLPLAILIHCALAQAGDPLAPGGTVSDAVIAQAAGSKDVDVLLLPRAAKAELAKGLPREREPRLRAAVGILRGRADASQAGIQRELRALGIPYRSFWVVNAIHARVPAHALARLAAIPDVGRIIPNPRVRMPLPELETAAFHAKALQASIVAVGAPTVWAQGFTGQGIVVGGQDTGYQWDHPALKSAYRGWNGTSADHSYNWHDAIHGPLDGNNPCGYSTLAPCDDNAHGTHTMGTVLGDNHAGEQIGMAPGARWIGCRNMDRGIGTPATYIECLEWMMAPTDLAGANPDPARAPHVINNSWSCPPVEGCDAEHAALLNEVVGNVRAAGILFVVSAGNSGPGCASIDDATATAAASFVVGASANTGAVANFSSRGPVSTIGAGVRPDLVAPGVAIQSSIPGTPGQPDRYGLASGTSMAAPHVAGAAALLMSARPWLVGNPEQVEMVLREGAVPKLSDQGCGGFSDIASPNAVYGHGFLDVPASVAVSVFADDFE